MCCSSETEGGSETNSIGYRIVSQGCQWLENGLSMKAGVREMLFLEINEAVRITSKQTDFIMTSKTEFHQAPIVRLVATSGLQAEQGEDHGWIAVGDRGARRKAACRGQ